MARTLPRFTDRLKLGRSGLAVSPFCLGMVDTPETVTAAFDRGINFFFVSADMHWPLYEPLRRGLHRLLRRPGVRDRVVVGAAGYPTQPEFCSMPFEELLEEIPELKCLDLLIAGGAYARELRDRLPVYVRHRAERFVGARAIGASFHDRKAAREVINQGALDIAFVRCNPEHPGARKDLFPHLKTPRRTLLFNFKSTLGSLEPAELEALGVKAASRWHPRVTDYYRFALSQPALDGLLIAPRTAGEIAELAKALEQGPLDAEEERYLLNLGLVSRGKAHVVPDN